MKSAHKLAAAVALLITLLVAAYFILMALQTAMSPERESVMVAATQDRPDERPTTTSASTTEPITRQRAQLNQSRLVELTTRPASAPDDQSVVRTLEVRPASSGDRVETSGIMEPATTAEPVEASSKAPVSEQPPASPASPDLSTPSTVSTEPSGSGGSTSENPMSLTTAEPLTSSSTTAATSETTLAPASSESSGAQSRGASSESTSSQPATSEQNNNSMSTTTMTTTTTTTTTTTATASPTDSEKLYRDTTTIPADGFQMTPGEERAWQEFKQQYGKSYGSAEEERRRAEKFAGNLRFINAHNRMPAVSFQLAVNQFADLSRDEINARHIGPLINWTSTLEGSGATKPPQLRILEEDQLAEEWAHSVDWRNSTTRAPLDQGACPESALFSVISSLEASLELAGFRGIRLSASQLMDCLAYAAPPPPAWPPLCSGQLSMVALWEFLQRQAIRLVPEAEYEAYRAAQRQGSAPAQSCVPPLAQGARDQRPKVVSYHQVPGEHFEVALQNRGPLVVAIDASRPTFHFYKSGLYHELQCSSDVYNLHALLVASQPASGEGATAMPAHLTLRASLGASWGEAGHIRLLKDAARNKCLPDQLATFPDLGFE